MKAVQALESKKGLPLGACTNNARNIPGDLQQQSGKETCSRSPAGPHAGAQPWAGTQRPPPAQSSPRAAAATVLAPSCHRRPSALHTLPLALPLQVEHTAHQDTTPSATDAMHLLFMCTVERLSNRLAVMPASIHSLIYVQQDRSWTPTDSSFRQTGE